MGGTAFVAGDIVSVADFDVARAIAKRDGGKVIDDFVVVPLKDVNGAMSYIYPGEGKMWQRGSNSCVTYVIGVLQAGGADLSAVPRSMNGGFWNVMKSLFL